LLKGKSYDKIGVNFTIVSLMRIKESKNLNFEWEKWEELRMKKQMRNYTQKGFQDTIKYLTKEEWRKLKESIDNFRDKVIINLLYSSGCRVSEIVLMNIGDIDFESGFIRIPKENTKTKESRTVRVGREVLNDIKAYLKLEKRKRGYLFRSRKGGRLSTRAITQMIHRYAEKAGIQKVYGKDSLGRPLYTITPQVIRNTHIIHAILKGIPIPIISKQVGNNRIVFASWDVTLEQIRTFYNTNNTIMLDGDVGRLKLYNSYSYKEVIPGTTREKVLKRDNKTCQYCGAKGMKMEMDHIIPESRGGETSVDNLVTACPDCNVKKGDRTPEEADMTFIKNKRIRKK